MLQVPRSEALLLEGFLLLQGLVERWLVTQEEEGERRQEEMQDPLVAQGEERWRVRVGFCPRV